MFSNKSIKSFLNYWLGPVLFIWLIWAIGQQISQQEDLPQAWANIRTVLLSPQSWKLAVVMAAMLLNWGIEARKWQLLLRPLVNISFSRSFKAVMAGVAFAVNTPNRIGEYGGRMLYLPEGKRLESVPLTVLGSFAQLLVTLVTGTGALWLLYAEKLNLALPPNWHDHGLWLGVLCWLMTTISVLLLLIYLRISRVWQLVPKLPAWAAAQVPVRILLRVVGWSFVRYVVFLFQYILLLQMFGVTENWFAAVWLLSLQFLVLSVVPTIALADLGIRGRLALELFGLIGSNSLGIVTTTTVIWLINLVIPALAGAVLIFRIRIFARST
ncbi:MAG: lysylphosphatidylglycerol synthase domain-containing protein [Flavihumibacter sp.]